MASLYEVTIRTRLDAAGLKAGDRQSQVYFDSMVARARRASSDMAQSFTVSMSRTTAAHSNSMRDRIKAIEAANVAEVKAERATHAEALRILKQKDKQIQASQREQIKAIEQANKAELSSDRQTHAEAMRIIKKKDAEINASIKAQAKAYERSEREKTALLKSEDRARAQAEKAAIAERERGIRAETAARQKQQRDIAVAVKNRIREEEQLEKQRQQNIKQISQGLKTTGQGVQSAGITMSAAVTVPIVAAAIGMISVGSEYEKAMNIFQATSKATGEEMDRAAKKAVQLGADLTLPATSAADAGDAMTALAKKGFTAVEAIDAARGVLQLSTAMMVETGEAAIVVANAVHMFGLEAKEATHVADLFASASVLSGTSLVEMAYSFEQAGPIFHMANVSIEDMVGLISELGLVGLKGEKAGTGLRAMMLALTAPTAEARKALRELNVEMFDQSGKLVSLRSIIGQMSPAIKKMTDEQRFSTLETIFGRRAIGAALVVMNQGVEGLDKMTKAQGHAGAAAELANARMKGLAGAWEGFKSQVETLALTIYGQFAPALTVVMQWIARVAQAIGGFAEAHPTIAAVVAVLGLLLATIGPLVIAFGMLISLAGSVVTAYGVLSAAVTAATAVLTANMYTVAALTTAIATLTIVITAAVLVIGLLVYAYMTWETAADKANNITMESVKAQAAAVAQSNQMKAAVNEVSAAQAGSADQHDKLNAIILQLSPNTQLYINALDTEQKKIIAVTAEVEKLNAAKLPQLKGTLIDLAPGMMDQKTQIDNFTKQLEAQKKLFEDIVNDRRPANWTSNKETEVKNATFAMKYLQDQLDPLNKSWTENAAKMNLATEAASMNRDSFMNLYTSAGMTKDQVAQMGVIYDMLHPKIDAATASTDKNAEAVQRQATALAKVRVQLNELLQGTDVEQSLIEGKILEVVGKATNTAEARKLAQAAAADPEIAKLIASRKLHSATEQVASSILKPDMKEMGLSGGGGSKKSPVENLEQQVKKAELAVKSLQATGGKEFELKFRLEDAKSVQKDLENILKLRHELGIQLKLPLPKTFEGIREETRLRTEQKKVIDEVTNAAYAQRDAEFDLASLIMRSTIPLVDAETRAMMKYHTALQARRNAELELTADLSAAVRERNKAMADEQSSLTDTIAQYKQLQLESVKAGEDARTGNIRSRLQFAIAAGSEGLIQQKIEMKLNADQLKPPLVTVAERVGTIIEQLKQILAKVGTGSADFASTGPASFKEAMGRFIDVLATRGVKTTLVSGERSLAEQTSIWNRRDKKTGLFRGNPVAPPGSSLHERDLAEDRSFSGPMSMAQIGALAESMGIEWGGRFSKPDPGHFQASKALRSKRAHAQSGRKRRRTFTPWVPSALDSEFIMPDDQEFTQVERIAAHGAGVNIADETQSTKYLLALKSERDATRLLIESKDDLKIAQAADVAIRAEALQQTGKSLEQLTFEAMLDKEKQDRITSDVIATASAMKVRHELASQAANDAEYQLRLERLLTEASRARAAQESKTLDEIAVKQDYLNKLRGDDPEVSRQLATRFKDKQVSAQVAATETIKELQFDIAHAGEDAADRYEIAWLTAIHAVQEADIQAVESQIASQVKIADASVYHAERVRARELEFLASQKSITELVGDFKVGILTEGFNSIDAVFQRLIGTGSRLKTLLSDLLSGLVKLALSQALGGGGGSGGGGAIGGLFRGMLGGGGAGGGLSQGTVSVGGGMLTGGFSGGPGGGGYTQAGFTGSGGLGSLGSMIPNLFSGSGSGSRIAIPQSATAAAQQAGSFGMGGMARSGAGMATQAASTAGRFSLGGLGAGLASMAPLLGLQLGGSLGGQSGIGGIMGSIGGLAGGLGVLAAAGALSSVVIPGAAGALALGGGIPILGSLFAGLGGSIGGSMGAIVAAAGPFAAIAAPLIIGAIIFAKNKARQQAEKVRDAASTETMVAINQLMADAVAGNLTVSQARAQWDAIGRTYAERTAGIKDSKTRRHAQDWWAQIEGTKIDPGGRTLPIWPKIEAAAKAGELAQKFKVAFVPTYAEGVTNGLVPFTGGAQTLIKVRPGERIDDPIAKRSWTVKGVDRGIDNVYTFASPGSAVYTKQQQMTVAPPSYAQGTAPQMGGSDKAPIIIRTSNDLAAVLLRVLLDGLKSDDGRDIIIDQAIRETLTTGKLANALDVARQRKSGNN